MPPVFEIGKPLPQHKAYEKDAKRRAFWRLSYRVPPEYLTGKDALGQELLVKHEREKDDSYSRRQRATKARNHCGPLIRKYNDFVFRRKPIAPEAKGDDLLALLLEDANGKGTGLFELLRAGLKRAQIEREVYYLPDSTKPPDAGEMTQAQAQEAGVRPTVRVIGADCAYWWRDQDGAMVEVLLVLRDAAGEPFARFYDAEATTDIIVKRDDKGGQLLVVSVGPPKPHNYGVCPPVRHRPLFDDAVDDADDESPGESQIGPLAELQQDAANKQSLLDSELYDCTFSQWIASGVDKARVGELDTGTTRIICLPDPASKFDSVGADPAQAASLDNAIDSTVRELHRIAGVSTDDPLKGVAAPESGVARAFKFNGLAANLAALADSCGKAGSELVGRIYTALGKPVPGALSFASDFDSPDFGAELVDVIKAVTISQLPKAIKRAAVLRFAARNLNLDTAQTKELSDEVDAIAAEDRTALTMPAGQPGS